MRRSGVIGSWGFWGFWGVLFLAAMASFSNLLAALSTRFREIEEGLKDLP